MTDPHARPRSQDSLIAEATEHGWTVTSSDPLIFEKSGKVIRIEFNGAGIPHAAHWEGEEFPSMAALGYLDLAVLSTWFDWSPKDSQ